MNLMLDPEETGDAVAEPPWSRDLDDVALVRTVAQLIARPKCTRSDSFVIHAPLELLARADLLLRSQGASRSAVRARIAAIATEYAMGDEIEDPRYCFSSPARALVQLAASLRAGDGEGTDASITFLCSRLSAQELRAALADEIVPFLGCAGHAPILLAALPEATAHLGNLSGLLRAPVRALAFGQRLRWIDEPQVEPAWDTHGDVFEALAEPEHVFSPNTSIAPTMLAVEAKGFAARVLSPALRGRSLSECRSALMRIAALSMLQDEPASAPYGWTHCLTLPQALLSLAPYSTDSSRCVRAAATYALGFRATLGRVRLDSARSAKPSRSVASLIAHAAAHPDTHLVKYTLACLKAADEDPDARELYLAAASYLGDWWATRSLQPEVHAGNHE
ncbi:MAG TPA: hypothetical protein VGD63_13985 [Steroidobacteraceae bacterium]